MDGLLRQSKDWLRLLHTEDLRKRYRVQSVFPSIREILNRIHSYCLSINIHIFDATTKTTVQIKTATTGSPTIATKAKDTEDPFSKPKQLTKARTMPISLAKWENDTEMEFPALTTSKSNKPDSQPKTEIERTHVLHSCKSTMDTIDIKEEANKSNSEICIPTTHTKDDAIQRSSNKITSTRSHDDISLKNARENSQEEKFLLKTSKGSDNLMVPGYKEHCTIHKERNTKSAEKETFLLRSPKSQGSQHFDGLSLIERKSKEFDSKLLINKTSIDRPTLENHSPNDISLFDLGMPSEAESLIFRSSHSTRHKGLTYQDIIILETMDKCQTTLDRKTSRYKFASIDANPSQESLIHSFFETDPISTKNNISAFKKSTEDLREFRLFDQSYSLLRLKKSH